MIALSQLSALPSLKQTHMAIQIKTLDQLKLMRKAGLVVGETLILIREAIKEGVTTSDLNEIAVKNLAANKAKPNFLNYHGYPAVICASVNDEIVHGIPNDRPIKNGDIVSIDFGAIIEGWHGDSAFSAICGAADPADQKLLDVCEQSMWQGIAAGKVGAKLTDISYAIEQYTNSQGSYGILREYGGHGIGTEMHQEPHVLNDEWTVVSQDGSRGAHFEQSFALLPDGKPFVLTAIDGGKEKLGLLGVEISTLLA